MTSKSELKRQNIMHGRPMMDGMETLERLHALKSLQTRIREATGADRELDLAICQAFAQPMAWSGDIEGLGSLPYTSDPDGLGACVALQRAVLPGCDWSKNRRGEIIISDELPAKIWAVVATAKPRANDCLTLLDAICAALIAEEEAKQKDAVE